MGARSSFSTLCKSWPGYTVLLASNIEKLTTRQHGDGEHELCHETGNDAEELMKKE